MNKNLNQYITVAELAKILKLSRVAVFNRIKKGQIPAEKIGRAYVISSRYVDDLVQYIDVSVLTEKRKSEIEKVVGRVIKEYGETLRLLGQE